MDGNTSKPLFEWPALILLCVQSKVELNYV